MGSPTLKPFCWCSYFFTDFNLGCNQISGWLGWLRSPPGFIWKNSSFLAEVQWCRDVLPTRSERFGNRFLTFLLQINQTNKKLWALSLEPRESIGMVAKFSICQQMTLQLLSMQPSHLRIVLSWPYSIWLTGTMLTQSNWKVDFKVFIPHCQVFDRTIWPLAIRKRIKCQFFECDLQGYCSFCQSRPCGKLSRCSNVPVPTCAHYKPLVLVDSQGHGVQDGTVWPRARHDSFHK